MLAWLFIYMKDITYHRKLRGQKSVLHFYRDYYILIIVPIFISKISKERGTNEAEKNL